MSDLLLFFRRVIPAIWDFFNIEFPLLGMTVFQVGIACIFISIGFRLIDFVLHDSTRFVPRIRSSGKSKDKE